MKLLLVLSFFLLGSAAEASVVCRDHWGHKMTLEGDTNMVSLRSHSEWLPSSGNLPFNGKTRSSLIFRHRSQNAPSIEVKEGVFNKGNGKVFYRYPNSHENNPPVLVDVLTCG